MVWMVKENQDSLAFELLDTRNDFVFKSIFGVEQNKDLLMAIVEMDIKEIVFVDPHLEMNHADDKASILDIRVLSNDSSMINIEIKLQNHHAFPERMLMYWAKMYANQDRKRQPYSKLNKTIQIGVTDFNFLPKEHFHSKFLLTETEDQFVYSHHIEMHAEAISKFGIFQYIKSETIAMTHHPNYRVSVEIILKKNDKILLTKRSKEATVAPGVWNVPAGKVKIHEIPLNAAYRELKEETNIDVEELLEIHVRTFEGNTVSEPIYRLIYTYVADITDAQLANLHLNDEHSEYVWVTQDELNDESYNSLLSEFREILTTIF